MLGERIIIIVEEKNRVLYNYSTETNNYFNT